MLQEHLTRCATKDLYGWLLTNCNDNILSESLNIVLKCAQPNSTITVPLAITVDRQLVFDPNSKYRGMTNRVSVRIPPGCRLQKSLLGNLHSYGWIYLGKHCTLWEQLTKCTHYSRFLLGLVPPSLSVHGQQMPAEPTIVVANLQAGRKGKGKIASNRVFCQPLPCPMDTLVCGETCLIAFTDFGPEVVKEEGSWT